MAIEIERKFLVVSEAWREGAKGRRFRQGYLCVSADATVRVRHAEERAFLTVKGATAGMSRAEFEYDIPLADAEVLLRDHCLKPLIEKTRYEVPFDGKVWTVDVFEGANAGLVVAEIELSDDAEQISLPPWIGVEVTDDPRYRNSALVSEPMKGEGATGEGI